MKYLVLLGVIFAVIWWLKLSREPSSTNTTSNPKPTQAMVACLHCGVHLPQNDAVHTAHGFYCSDQHRALKEG